MVVLRIIVIEDETQSTKLTEPLDIIMPLSQLPGRKLDHWELLKYPRNY